jgi:ADP-ribose pyrophosphatase YjhB (NUDIX family)
MAQKNSHCSYCGAPFAVEVPWPRACGGCGNRSYLNPLPVAVVLVPVGAGVLLVRRAIPPQVGMLALPGGFIGLGESWQEAGAREVLEEAGIAIDPGAIADFYARSSPDGHLLIFGVAPPLAGLPPFAPTEEASELVVARAPTELAFPLHTAALRFFFERREAKCEGRKGQP